MTNYERIKAMSVEEMAAVLADYHPCNHTTKCSEYRSCVQCAVAWLESEVDDGA